jgi:hypothetical protein
VNAAELVSVALLSSALGALAGAWASRRSIRRLVRVLDAEHLARQARPEHGRLLDPRAVVASKVRLMGAILGHQGRRR